VRGFWFVVLSLVIALGLAAGPVKIASVGLSPAGGVSPQSAEFVSEHFAAKLATAAGLEVTTRKAIATMLGLERQRQLLGCADDSSSCMAELAGALGAEVVLVGELAQLDTSLQVNVRAMEARTARVLHSAVVRADTQEQLLDRLDGAARQMAVALQDHYGIPRPTRWQPWLVVGTGLVTAGVGGIFLAQAARAWSTLNAPATAATGPSDAATLAQQGSLAQGLGIAFMSVGAVLVAGGLTWFALGTDGPALAVAVAPGSGLVSLSWRLP
jgi:TolB-like protein